MKKSRKPYKLPMPSWEEIHSPGFERWAPHVDFQRRLAVHPFHISLLAGWDRWNRASIEVTAYPEWLEYIGDEIGEFVILNALVYVYCRGRVRRWLRGLCVLDQVTTDLFRQLRWPADWIWSALTSLKEKRLVFVGKLGSLALDWIAWRDAFLANGGAPGDISYLQPALPKDVAKLF